MAIELATKYAAYTDEIFKAESKTRLVTNQDFDWSGAHTVKVWKLSTAPMNDYGRNRTEETGAAEEISRYGKILDLSAQTEEMMLRRDRSFIFNVDLLDCDETARQVEAASALARQIRQVIIPEIDQYTFNKMVEGAGTTLDTKKTPLEVDNVYPIILSASEAMDVMEVPDTERVILVTPTVYTMLKQAQPLDNNDIGADLRLKGVIGLLDGMQVVKVPSSRLPKGVNFIVAHPSTTVAPIKLEDYKIHEDTPLSSGSIVTGRICYDAFVLENKKYGIVVCKDVEQEEV